MQKEHLEQYLCEVTYIGTYTNAIIFYEYNDIQSITDWYDCDDNIDCFEENFLKYTDDFGSPKEISISIPFYAYPYTKIMIATILMKWKKILLIIIKAF